MNNLVPRSERAVLVHIRYYYNRQINSGEKKLKVFLRMPDEDKLRRISYNKSDIVKPLLSEWKKQVDMEKFTIDEYYKYSFESLIKNIQSSVLIL